MSSNLGTLAVLRNAFARTTPAFAPQMPTHHDYYTVIFTSAFNVLRVRRTFSGKVANAATAKAAGQVALRRLRRLAVRRVNGVKTYCIVDSNSFRTMLVGGMAVRGQRSRNAAKVS